MMRRLIVTIAILITTLTLFSNIPALAQDNLLVNAGLDEGDAGSYSGRGRGDLNIPNSWEVWLGQGSTDSFYNRGDKVFGFPHRGPGPDPIQGGTAASLKGNYVQFNAAIFQTVSTSEGTNLRGEAAAYIRSCGGESGSCGANSDTDARVRIGIDPDGGSDPNAPEIVWSGFSRPNDTWDRVSVEATATGGSATLFLYATQSAPSNTNWVFWDDALLTVGGGGGSSGEGGDDNNAAAAPAPVPNFVPFVNPQGERDDGSVVHSVQSGDTLDSIAVAYGLTRQELVDRNPTLQSIRFLQIGQQLIIQTPEPVAEVLEEEAGTPIPGGVVTEEAAAAPVSSATEEAEDAVINSDPKGLNPVVTEAPGDADSGNLLDSMGTILGSLDSSEAVPADNVNSDDDAESTTTEEAASVDESEATEEATSADEQAVATATPEATTVAQVAVISADNLPSVDISASTVAVCVSLFEDINQNRLRETDEGLIADGNIILSKDNAEIGNYTTNGQSEPHCFNELVAGEYVAVVNAPEGYGLTTPNQLRLPLTAGASLNIEFGAAQGVQPNVVPPPNTNNDLGDSAADVLPAETDSLLDTIVSMSGIIIAGLAGVIVVAGVGATILLRRGR